MLAIHNGTGFVPAGCDDVDKGFYHFQNGLDTTLNRFENRQKP